MSEETSITILGDIIPTSNEEIAIEKLKYLPTNPRVRTALALSSGNKKSTDDYEEIQEIVHDKMISEPSVKNLIPEIENHGGLLEPIFVRQDTREVIEGNSRLRAYRHLDSNDTERSGKWEKISCQVVKSLTNKQQYAYLHQIHVKGKTPWQTYEKAYIAYELWDNEKTLIPEIATTLSITPGEVEKRIKIIENMRENNDSTLSHFSYYGVLVRSRKISSEIEKNQPLKETLLKKIKDMDTSSDSDASFTAQELRDKLPVIIGKKKLLKKFIDGKSNFEDAYQNARISGPIQSIKKATGKIENITKDELSGQSKIELNTLDNEIRRMNKSIKRLHGMLDEAKKQIS